MQGCEKSHQIVFLLQMPWARLNNNNGFQSLPSRTLPGPFRYAERGPAGFLSDLDRFSKGGNGRRPFNLNIS